MEGPPFSTVISFNFERVAQNSSPSFLLWSSANSYVLSSGIRFTEASAASASPCYGGRQRSLLGGPTFTLYFAGNAGAALPRRNYDVGFDGGERATGGLPFADERPGYWKRWRGRWANFQQRTSEVVCDLERRRVCFARRRCAAAGTPSRAGELARCGLCPRAVAKFDSEVLTG